MYRKILLAAAFSVTIFGGLVQAETQTNGIPAEKVAALSEKLKPLFGDVPDQLNKTPIAGVYEVVFGTDMIYVSADGRYFFSGDLIDGQTRTNLSEAARTDARKLEMDKVLEQDAVEFKAKGEQKHLLTVFTDIDCGFCVRLHREVPKLNELGVTVRYLAYPRAGVGSPSYKKLVNVWCAEDKLEAMNKSKSGETIADKECENPVAEQFELGRKVGVNGTPALVASNGTLISGFRPADQLVKLLDDMVASESAAN
ncbi:MAG: disulfide bond isomerase [Proteobacteria bacterium]|nr:MAG: disulfide bond isomerase [Pseudomonadota bacterium]